jgi:hypothetical protein
MWGQVHSISLRSLLPMAPAVGPSAGVRDHVPSVEPAAAATAIAPAPGAARISWRHRHAGPDLT